MNSLKIVFLVIFYSTCTSAETSSRQKRYLIYPKYGSKVQLIMGTGVPIPLEKQAITMGWVLKAKYLLPTNSSEYTDSYVTLQKRSIKKKASRYDFYKFYEVAGNSFGVGGKECMLRSICEASKIPFKASGLLGQIFKIFLLPSSTNETPLTSSDMEYHSAEILGREKMADCKALYPSCTLSLLDLLTVII